MSKEEIRSYFEGTFVLVIAVVFLSFFLGVGIGQGEKVSKSIANGDLKYNCILTYNTNETKEVYLINSNSSNYFYVEKGSKNINISPVSAVKKITLESEK